MSRFFDIDLSVTFLTLRPFSAMRFPVASHSAFFIIG